MKKNIAFTLAEVLITLTIIGVIAVITIPNLMQKYTEQVTVNKVKKFYSTISNAYKMSIKENGNIEDWEVTDNNNKNAETIYNNLFKPYFKIAKNCGFKTNVDCIVNNNYKKLNNTNHYNYNLSNEFYKLNLDDGSAIFFRAYSKEEQENYNFYFNIFLDINGIKSPNQLGKDLFHFTALNNEIIPSGAPNDNINNFKDYCNKNSSGFGCAGWLIYKGNMDYLRCDDLSWDGKSKCSK